ncbi:MAG: DUF4065 domain-containing protein [Parachlamydiaceae bacterium]|nr:DUF4065 domain-containing protein [Parachlamydiaceae bacterium]
MANAIEVAEYILEKTGSMTAMKLQKLVYYSQAWHLVWMDKPLFKDKIEAWRNGPVIPILFELHQGNFKLDPGFFKNRLPQSNLNAPTKKSQDVIDRVINYYGAKDPHWLSQLAHMEDPWKTAHTHCPIVHKDQCIVEITPQSMKDYYSSL